MKKYGKALVLTLGFALTIGAGSAMAGNGKGAPSTNGDQDRIQDGSCLDDLGQGTAKKTFTLAGNGKGAPSTNGDQDRDRTQDQDMLQDGSCLDRGTVKKVFIIAGNGDQDRDRTQDQDMLQDGSCLITG